jgi:hypothetical protein
VVKTDDAITPASESTGPAASIRGEICGFSSGARDGGKQGSLASQSEREGDESDVMIAYHPLGASVNAMLRYGQKPKPKIPDRDFPK